MVRRFAWWRHKNERAEKVLRMRHKILGAGQDVKASDNPDHASVKVCVQQRSWLSDHGQGPPKEQAEQANNRWTGKENNDRSYDIIDEQIRPAVPENCNRVSGKVLLSGRRYGGRKCHTPNENKMSHRANYKKYSCAENSGHTDDSRLAPSHG